MAKGNFDQCMKHVFQHEGGYSSDRNDPGNWTGGVVGKGQLKGTKYGIAANSYPSLDIKNLTQAQAKAIYRKDYWNKLSCDDLPDGLDYTVFDSGINNGVNRAGKFLQSLVPGVRLDGVVGEATLKRVCDIPPETAILRFNDARLAFHKKLKTWKLYGKGWERRINEVKKISLAMHRGEAVSKLKLAAVNAGHSDKAREEDLKALASTESQVAAVPAAGAAGTTVIEGVEKIKDVSETVASNIEPYAYWIEWLQYICIGLMIIGGLLTVYMIVKKQRSEVVNV